MRQPGLAGFEQAHGARFSSPGKAGVSPRRSFSPMVIVQSDRVTVRVESAHPCRSPPPAMTGGDSSSSGIPKVPSYPPAGCRKICIVTEPNVGVGIDVRDVQLGPAWRQGGSHPEAQGLSPSKLPPRDRPRRALMPSAHGRGRHVPTLNACRRPSSARVRDLPTLDCGARTSIDFAGIELSGLKHNCSTLQRSHWVGSAAAGARWRYG